MSLNEIFSRFDYYAKPEGHAPLDKLIGCSKFGAVTGLFIGLQDALMYSRTKTMYETVRCFGFWMVPLSGMGAAFASTTYIATNLRGKDDHWNYVMGAISAGGVFHAWQKNGLATLYATIILSIFAACKKDSKESGWTFFPTEVIDCEFKYPLIQTASAREKKYERGWTT